jgi:hypothetical protein
MCFSLSGCKLINFITGDGPPYRKEFVFVLPDGRLTEKELCGKKDCVPGTLGSPFSFTKKTYSVDVNKNITQEEIAIQVLGHTIDVGDFRGKFAPPCSQTDNKSPFNNSDISKLSSINGSEMDYERKESLNFEGTLDAAVEENLDEIKKYTNNSNLINELEAKIKAEYTKLDGKLLTIKGTYSEWGLTSQAMSKLIKGTDFKDCRTYLTNNKKRIITAVGIVHYDIKFKQNSLNEIASEIQSFAQSKGIQANLAFTFKREVSKKLERVTNDYYQILTWRHAGVETLENL